MTKEQIDHMVRQFLNWQLPEDFQPDGGISFEQVMNAHTSHPVVRTPNGTNLLTATQAEAMVRHMIKDMPIG